MRTPTAGRSLPLALLLLGLPFSPSYLAALHRAPSRQASQVPKDAAEGLGLAWSDAVERHEPGQMDGPAKVVAEWSAEQLQKAGGRVRAGLEAALRNAIAEGTEEEARRIRRLIDRGALLHTDIGLSLEGKGAAGFSNVLLLADGQARGVGNSLHFEFAAALLELDADPRARERARAWYRAVTASLLHRGRLGEAAMLLRLWRESALSQRRAGRGRRGDRAADPGAFPSDEAFLFDYGCLHEGLMAPGVRVVLTDRFERPTSAASPSGWAMRTTTFRTRIEEFAAHAEQAFRAFRKVVEMNPRAAEARVRLGHVECVRGNCGSGMRNIRRGVELAGDDAAIRYYAAMFVGQEEEAHGRFEEARKEYERAAALFPLAQSPLLALSALANRTGDRQAAGRHASRLWALPADVEHRYDPWWDYDGGPRDGESLLRQVYRLMEGGADGRQ